MPLNGNTFTRLYSWVANAALGIKIRADLMDQDSNDIAGGISAVATAISSLSSTVTTDFSNLASGSGSSSVGYLEGGTGTQSRTVQDKLRETGVSVFDFFTPAQIADVVTNTASLDLTTAIQAALDFVAGQTSTTVGSKGGRLIFPPGKYRFTNTLYYGFGTIIEGAWAGGYPYVGSGTQATILYADFGVNINRWALDSQTFHSVAGGGGRILYNEWVTDQIAGTGAQGFTATYGAQIRGILLIDANNALQTNVIYGSIRANGCPNIRLENVSILGFGLAPTFGCSYGATMRNCTGQTNYYGPIYYNANNGIGLTGCQFDKVISPASLAVPVGVIPSWMPSAANFASVYNLDGSHNTTAKGLIIAAAASIGSNGATVDCIGQYWPDLVFLNNSYSTTFTNLYSEACTGPSATSGYVLTTAYASFNVLNAHNFSGASPLPYFSDIGYNSVGKINVGGNNTNVAFWKNAWGSLSGADGTRVSIINVSGTGGTLPANQRVTMEYEEGSWTPVVTSTGGALSSVTSLSGTYTKTRDMVRVEYQFTIANAGTGSGNLVIAGLPYQARTQQFQLVLTNSNKTGQLVTGVGSTQLSLFNSDGTFPGATGVTYFGIITYLV